MHGISKPYLRASYHVYKTGCLLVRDISFPENILRGGCGLSPPLPPPLTFTVDTAVAMTSTTLVADMARTSPAVDAAATISWLL